MGTTETSIGGKRRDFPSTSWTLIRKAKKNSPESLERLIYLYWKPAYYYLRAAGKRDVEDAKDLAQEFFARLVERKDWERLDPERGSFRGFLKRALKNFIIDASRREQVRRPRSGAFLFRFEDCRDGPEPADRSDAEDVFDKEWVQTVLRDSIRALEERLKGEGSANLFEVFRLYCLPDPKSGDPGETSRFMKGGEAGGKTYAEVATKLGLRESDVRKRLARCRAVLRDIVLERIRDYAGDASEIRVEYERIVKG